MGVVCVGMVPVAFSSSRCAICLAGILTRLSTCFGYSIPTCQAMIRGEIAGGQHTFGMQ